MNAPIPTTPPAEPSLYARWQALRSRAPRTRIRDAAAQLGVSEATLLQSRPDGVTRLGDDPRPVLRALAAVGRTMVLTRNDDCVHERKGCWEKVSVRGPVGLVLGPDIDLRLFLSQWAVGFAVESTGPRGPLRSLQFFDAHGDAVCKVYHQPEGGDGAAWDQLIATHQAPAAPFVATPASPEPPAPTDTTVDPALLADWAALQDTHDFHGMLRRHGVARLVALRGALGRFTARLDRQAPTALLEAAAAQGLDIMVFVGNPGCIQIHTGPVQRIVPISGNTDWINVLDPDFNLHLRSDTPAEAFLVRKPTADGVVTSVELLDPQGRVIVQFFGARKPGIPEDPAWRALAESLVPTA